MLRTPWAWRARLGPPPPDWLLKWFTSTHTFASLSSRHWYWAVAAEEMLAGRAGVGEVDVAAYGADLDLGAGQDADVDAAGVVAVDQHDVAVLAGQ
jgi:hypothetical protein